MHYQMLQSLKRLTQFACLGLLLISIGGCASLGQGNYTAVAPQLPPLPKDVKACLKNHVELPEGDWNANVVAKIIAQYQGREYELESCLRINAKFYQDLREGLGSKGKKWFKR